jgi:hypothetical protein
MHHVHMDALVVQRHVHNEAVEHRPHVLDVEHQVPDRLNRNLDVTHQVPDTLHDNFNLLQELLVRKLPEHTQPSVPGVRPEPVTATRTRVIGCGLSAAGHRLRAIGAGHRLRGRGWLTPNTTSIVTDTGGREEGLTHDLREC